MSIRILFGTVLLYASSHCIADSPLPEELIFRMVPSALVDEPARTSANDVEGEYLKAWLEPFSNGNYIHHEFRENGSLLHSYFITVGVQAEYEDIKFCQNIIDSGSVMLLPDKQKKRNSFHRKSGG